MSEATELLDQLMIEQKARLKAIAQLTDLTHERDELKARIVELETELRIEISHRVNQNIIDLLDFADARPDLWEYLLHKNKDKVSKLVEILK